MRIQIRRVPLTTTTQSAVVNGIGFPAERADPKALASCDLDKIRRQAYPSCAAIAAAGLTNFRHEPVEILLFLGFQFEIPAVDGCA